MAKRPDITTVATGYFGRQALNDNFTQIQTAFDNTLSLDGSTPNAMQGDLDLNGYGIANVGSLRVGGQDIIAVTKGYRDSASASAIAAASSETAAATSASDASDTWDLISPYTDEIQVLADDLIAGDFVAGDIYDFGSITSPTTGTSGSPDGFIVQAVNNLDDIETVATNIASVNTVAGIETEIVAVDANEANILTVGTIASDVTSVASISADVTSAAGIASDITAVAADATDIGAVAGDIANVNTVASLSADITAVVADATDIGTVAGLSTEVAALGPISADITTAAANTTNINTVATNDANITTVAGVSTDVTTVSGISANVTTVAGISADVSTVAGDSADISTVATDIANVNTVAGIASDIGIVAGNDANVAAVGTDIANVNTVAANIADVNTFGETYRIGTTDPTTSLDVGDLFFNSTTGVLKVYDGSGWTAGVTAGSGFLALTGGTLTGDLVLNADPTLAKGAATKEYVDTIAAAGLHYHDPVRVESPVDLPSTYSNGTAGVGATLTNSGTQAALIVDGVTLSTNDRVLLYHQANAAHNGIYEVTDTGSASTNWVLTRTSDADTYSPSDPASLGQGDAFFVQEGATGAGELYVMNTSGAITFGTTNITFTQISSAAIYSAGTGVTLNGTEINIGQAVGTADSPTFANISVTGNVDGRNVSADGTKLDGIESGATGDQTPAELLTAIKTVDGTTSGLDSDLLDGEEGSYYLDGNNFINLPAGYANADVDTHLNTGGASSGQYLGWNGSDYAWSTVDLSTKLNLTGGTLTGTLNGTDASFSGTVTAVNFNTTSDARLKTNVEPLTGSLEKVKDLRGVSFDWKATHAPDIGFIAQEVAEVLPEMVSHGDEGTLSVKYSNIVAVLVEAIKEQQAQIDELKEKVGV